MTWGPMYILPFKIKLNYRKKKLNFVKQLNDNVIRGWWLLRLHQRIVFVCVLYFPFMCMSWVWQVYFYIILFSFFFFFQFLLKRNSCLACSSEFPLFCNYSETSRRLWSEPLSLFHYKSLYSPTFAFFMMVDCSFYMYTINPQFCPCST